MWIALIVIAVLGLGVYLFRDKLKKLLGKMPPKDSLPFPEDPSELPDEVLNPVPPPEIVPDIPEPPLVDAPIVREDDPPVVGGKHGPLPPEPGRDEFGGPTRWPDLLEVTLKQILDYVPTLRERYRNEGRYFIDHTLEGSVKKNNRLSPGFLVSARAWTEAEAIPTFDHGLLGGGRPHDEVIQEWVENVLEPVLQEGELETLSSPAASTTPGKIGRLRAMYDRPAWLAELMDEQT